MTIAAALPSSINTQSNLSQATPVELDGVALRWTKIEHLRHQIAAGNYHVSSLELASCMIDAMMR